MKIRIIKYVTFWNVRDARENPTWLFVFGDNDEQHGNGGQAQIRDEPNSIGIPTKKAPSYDPNSFYNDNEFTQNCGNIKRACFHILSILKSNKYDTLVLPFDGFGTGLANLDTKAPKTFEFLLEIVELMIKQLK